MYSLKCEKCGSKFINRHELKFCSRECYFEAQKGKKRVLKPKENITIDPKWLTRGTISI